MTPTETAARAPERSRNLDPTDRFMTSQAFLERLAEARDPDPRRLVRTAATARDFFARLPG